MELLIKIKKAKKKRLKIIIVIIFGNFLIFSQIFVSQKVEQSNSISEKYGIYGIYKLPHELPNDLRLNILGYWSEESQNFMQLQHSA